MVSNGGRHFLPFLPIFFAMTNLPAATQGVDLYVDPDVKLPLTDVNDDWTSVHATLTAVKVGLTHDEEGVRQAASPQPRRGGGGAERSASPCGRPGRLREEAEALELGAVIEARRQRATWSEIGAVYGTSKRSTQQRLRMAVRDEGPNR
jgi:hypothetical protein